jgi:predicted transcriptional regulator
MSDKVLVLEAVSKMPEDATIADIRKEIDFIGAIKKGREQVLRGEIVSLDEVEKKISTWTGK